MVDAQGSVPKGKGHWTYLCRSISLTCLYLPNEEPPLLATRHNPAELRQWRLQALDVSGDYAAALAIPSAIWKLKCWNWPPLTLTTSNTLFAMNLNQSVHKGFPSGRYSSICP